MNSCPPTPRCLEVVGRLRRDHFSALRAAELFAGSAAPLLRSVGPDPAQRAAAGKSRQYGDKYSISCLLAFSDCMKNNSWTLEIILDEESRIAYWCCPSDAFSSDSNSGRASERASVSFSQARMSFRPAFSTGRMLLARASLPKRLGPAWNTSEPPAVPLEQEGGEL